MIAFHYPPEGSSSGVQRTLSFSRYLRDSGWEPIVLTANPRAYTVRRDDQLGDIPDGVVVRRAFAVDAGRHLAVSGRYPRFAALPDRWVSWWVGAVAAGWRLVRKYRPDVLWSTYPIATAHAIGHSLQKLTRLPWVADFRDSMTEEDYPRDARQWRAYRRVERNTLGVASRVVFTAPGAVRMYRERYPEVDASRFSVIPNGYDEASFAEAERNAGGRSSKSKTTLLHSGVLYPSERDPRCFFAALARLLRSQQIDSGSLQIVLRNTGHDEYHRALVDKYGVQSVVSLAPPLAYREALREMLDVQGLIILQGASCNHQVPAKIYEYFRARKPILALTDPAGDTAKVLRDASLGSIAPLDDEELIADELVSFVKAVRSEDAPIAADAHIALHSRQARARALAGLLSEASQDRAR